MGIKVRRKDKVPRILEEMRKYGGKPNSVVYDAWISLFCKEKDFETAFRLLNEMGDKANLISYNVLLGGLCKEGKSGEAKDLLRICIDVVAILMLSPRG